MQVNFHPRAKLVPFVEVKGSNTIKPILKKSYQTLCVLSQIKKAIRRDGKSPDLKVKDK